MSGKTAKTARHGTVKLWQRCGRLHSSTGYRLQSTRLTSRILICTELKGHCFVCFSFWLRVLD